MPIPENYRADYPFSQEQGQELIETMKQTNAVLAANGMAGGLQPKSYADIARIVRLGLAPAVFSIGDIIEVSRETAIQASLGAHAGITGVTVAEDTFIAAMGETGEKEYEIVFDGSAWHLGNEAIILADYGIAVTGTAAEGDTIIIVETAATIDFVVVDFIEDGKTPIGDIVLHDKTKKYGMILQSKDTLYDLQFDEREAFYYSEEGLAAGQYCFLLGAHSWVAADVNKYFNFTLTQALPAGGVLVMKQAYNATLVGGGIDSFASASAASPIETVTMAEGQAGTLLGTLDNSVQAAFNSCQRALLGSNRWGTSAMRQQLNSAAKANSVWTSQTVFDRPPSWVSNTKGFINGLDPSFAKLIAEVELLTALSALCDTTPAAGTAGTGFETTVDRVFLPSRPEVYGGSDNNSDKGTPWEYYSANSDLSAAGSAADSNRIKTNSSGTAKYWWLRSPNVGYGASVRNVTPSGNVSDGSAHIAFGTAPACILA